MDALGPDLQTIYNLLHDLKRFPLPQSEHQAEQSRSEGRGVLCVQVSPLSSHPPPQGWPREGEGAGTCSLQAGGMGWLLLGFFKSFFGVQDSDGESGRWNVAEPLSLQTEEWQSIPGQPSFLYWH